jgi:hypothetical protein
VVAGRDEETVMVSGHLVRLRPIEPAEWESLWRWSGDPEVMRWMFDGYPQSPAARS